MPKTILVVEDERALQSAIKTMLERQKFTVLTASTASKALELLNETKVDAIWLDHYLIGDQNGLDLVTKLKAEDSPWKKIPVIVVSNSSSPQKVNSYLELGVTEYLSKSDYKLDDIIKKFKEL